MKKICCIVNPVSGLKKSLKVYYEAKNHFEKFSSISSKFLDIKLTYLGCLNNSKLIRQSILSRTPIIDRLNKGINILFDIDWQGADQIKNKKLDYKLITFFILPPSKEVLFQRLSNRDMKDKLIVEERMKQFGRDVLHWINYDYVVINENLESCYSKIHNLIQAEINDGSKDYDPQYIRKHIENLTS